MVFELCERWSSLGVQALRAVSAEFHEDAGTASLAADSVSFAVERFQVSAVGALVVNEFNHTSLSVSRDLASCFEPFIAQAFLSGVVRRDGHHHQLTALVELKHFHPHGLD